MESESKQQKADFSELANSITDVFFAMDKDLRYVFWNRASEVFTGIKANDAIGKTFYDLFPQSIGESSELAYLEVLRTKQPKSFLNVSEINGENRHLEINVYPAGNGLSVFVRDITARIIAEKALQESEARFRRIFDESPVGSAIVGLDFKFLRVNGSFCKFIGYSHKELLKMGFVEITHPDDVQSDIASVNQVLSGEIDQFEKEKRYVCKNGAIKWAHLSIRLVRDSFGKPLYLIPIIQDINDLKNLMSELVLAKEQAEEMNRRKSKFLTNMSHELRTPLNGILGFSELLMEEKDPERVQKMAEVINKSGDRLLETLNLILDLSKLETGATVPQFSPLDLVELAEESIQLYRATAIKKNLKLALIKSSPVLIIDSDRKIIRDIMNNLINNALKFTHAGRVTIRLDEVTDEGMTWCMIEIADTGIGIAEENLTIIFEEFRQINSTIDTGIKGSGLGLSLCKKYSELLGGTIHVSSKLNVGSVFTVWLPIL